jgi:ribosomal protein S18 acetylase RimI-like enzyme
MPRLTDTHEIRAILRRDPLWCVYALGDLAPKMVAKTQWFTPDLTLVLHDYGTSILFAMGTGGVREALAHVTWPVHLQVQADALDEVTQHATIEGTRLMWRMGWSGHPSPASTAGAERLGTKDVTALQQLYADGDATGESPDFFFPSMVTDGVFFGVYEAEMLVAAAGTHVLANEEGAAAIGNIYTRRDRRGRGLGRIVTSRVLDSVKGLETVGLNVRADNHAALHLYESLGFVRHCPFYEGLATGLR